MFRQRTSSQKPGDDLLANFRKQFPQVATGSSAAVPSTQTSTAGDPAITASTDESRAPGLGHEAFHDQDPTPRASNEPWRFTPSVMDANSFHFANFADAAAHYTLAPGSMNTLYHPQAGDLHTPTLSFGIVGLSTPLSMPATQTHMQPATAMMDLSTGFHHAAASGLHPSQFHHQQFHHFVQPHPPQHSFSPSILVHQDTGYETIDRDGSPTSSDLADESMASIDNPFHRQSPIPMGGFQARQDLGMGMSSPLRMHPSADKFRFHVTLNAPTAMIKHVDDIPVTYLNKGQAYSLSIVDTQPNVPVAAGLRFRTCIRVSFEDEQQRQKPGVCWSLWKEGRGTNEAYQRGGKLQAVEFVESGQPADGEDKGTKVELDSASFDGFCVLWTPSINGAVECNVAVRFNFLSTDFSHSKGVKGIPVRLCAKTAIDTTGRFSGQASPDTDKLTEICYCKVKLFRDHGAERKLSNDVAHVKKTIDKLRQQIAQAENGPKDCEKRKRAAGASETKGAQRQRPGKVQKHKRTWSMSPASSTGRNAVEGDLHVKLQTLQDMFTSTRPVSVLNLAGERLDDAHVHPVFFPGHSPPALIKTESHEGNICKDRRSTQSSVVGSLVSPSPSSLSLHSATSASGPSVPWQESVVVGSDPSSRQGSDQPLRMPKADESGNLSGWIEALGVDPSYRPPSERAVRPVACFYVLRKTTVAPGGREYHKAIYLMQRTLAEFIASIASKWNFDPTRVLRVVHILQNGIEVEVDDDVIRELSEGQDMVLDVVEMEAPVRCEWEMSLDNDVPGEEGQAPATELQQQRPCALRLLF